MLEKFIINIETMKMNINKTDFYNYYYDVHTNIYDDYALYDKYGHCV